MHTLRLLTLAFAAALSFLSMANAQPTPESTRDLLDKWVQTRQLTSKEKSDWRLEQSILTDTKALLSAELTRLDISLKELEGSATAADKDRTDLTAQKEDIAEATTVVKQHIGALEAQLKTIIKTFPTPLIERTNPLIRRLPNDPTDTTLSMGERLQNIVGILNQADKFNSTLTQTSEARTTDSGKIVEVRTLYWGLATAYYVDTSGEYAGIGIPSKDGWLWPQIKDAGPKIKELFDIYEGSADIKFVELPARIN